MATKYKWWKVTKHYRGGSSMWQIRVPDIKVPKDDWDEIMNWIGERTDGGHSGGYTMYYDEMPRKDRTLKVMTYPADITESLAKFGRNITTTTVRRMI